MRSDASWNMGARPALADEGLHQAFARVAAARPAANALVGREGVMTYSELDHASTSWACALAAAGVGPGHFVPIVLPRGADLVIALLAVLKTGAAYALLDPAWPRGRIDDVLDQLGAPMQVGRYSPQQPVWVPPATNAAQPEGFRPVAVGGGSPCSVFFTSGTTGRAKGVVTPHRATARLFAANSPLRFDVCSVVPLAAPTPWDAFSLELWSVLLNGGTSVIVDEPYLTSQWLRHGVAEYGVQTVWLTSSLFNMAVDEDLASFAGVHQVLTGGERLSSAHVARFLRQYPDTSLINGYGPVESTVFATTHRVLAEDCDSPYGIPIGRPVPHTDIHLLDGNEPCMPGRIGEICIAGAGLALSYLGADPTSDDAFVDLVIEGGPARVYRTGDLGMWDHRGRLCFRGRGDRQVKIRGHRVEPDEVARQIENLVPAIRACRVVARSTPSADANELVAFCVPLTPGDPLDLAMPVLREHLVAYQRPARLISLPEFAINAHGKIDDAALLAAVPADPMGYSGSSTRRSSATPADDEIVRAVMSAFAAVLGNHVIDRNRPFFEHGGDSLAAGRLCARLAATLNRPVPISQLYRTSTAQSLAAWLRTTPAVTDSSAPHAVDRAPLTPMQVLYLTRHLVDPDDRSAHCLLTWEVEGQLDLRALEAGVAAVHAHHEPLRAAYRLDPTPHAVLVDVPAPPVELFADHLSTSEAAATLRRELGEPLEPLDADVWRVAVVPLPLRRSTLLGVVVHHLAFDGWSEAVLAGDLAAAYSASRCGQLVAPAPRTSLADVHAAFVRQSSTAALAALVEQLHDDLIDLPIMRWPVASAGGTDRTRSDGMPAHVDSVLDVELVAGVDALARNAGVTRFVVLLTIWAHALATVSGQSDLAIGVPVAQRDGPGREYAVGCFINIVCVRLRSAALTGDRPAYAATSAAVHRALAAQDVPFSDIVELVGATRAGRPPVFQTLFALQDNAIPALALADARTTFLRQPYLGLPLELHTEVWPAPGGQLRIAVSSQTSAVDAHSAAQLCATFAHYVRTAAAGRLR